MPRIDERLQAVTGLAARFQSAVLPHFINGRPAPGVSGATFESLSPIDNSPIGSVDAGSAADIDLACQAAANAFDEWKAMAGGERRRILRKIADAIEANAKEIALIESWDCGQPLKFMSKAAIRGAENFRFFADRAPSARDGLSLPAEQHVNFTQRQPIGPIAVITPWNTPFMLSTWKIAPALAAGCTVVHKPAEWSPYTAMLLAEIAHDAGLPPGVLNCVQGLGGQAGRMLTEHPAIKAVAFIGESLTGRRIIKQGADTLKRVHLELGGKNPVIVFADADLERALDAVVFMIFSLNGERCTSSSRLLIEKSIERRFIDRLIERVSRLKVGNPLDPDTEIGPLIHPEHHEKVCGFFKYAIEDGADIVAGGSPIEGPGNYVQPTVIAGASNRMRIARQEIFGPVLTVIPFAGEDEALRIANETEYGLAGYIWSSDAGRAHRMAQGLDVGMVWVNSENNRHLPSPFGGMKASGIGRDGGDYSFEFYMETKNICVAFDRHRIPRMGAGS